MVAVNLLYDVGSSDENPAKTGLAHLMEHLMFSGTKHVSKYDDMLQRAGGDSNAWTNIDVTNYYDAYDKIYEKWEFDDEWDNMDDMLKSFRQRMNGKILELSEWSEATG